MNYETSTDISNYADYMKKYNPTESSELLPFVNYEGMNTTSDIKNNKNNINLPLNISNTLGFSNPIIDIPETPVTIETPKVSIPTTTSVILPKSKGEEGKAKEMIGFLVNKGLSKEAASGIIGNLMVESGLKTTPLGDKGTSFGLAQWRDPTPGQGRWTNLKNFTTNRGLDINSINGQMEYLWHELNTSHKPLLTQLQSVKTPEQAADLFRVHYERPAANPRQEELRRQYGRKYLTV